MIEILNFLLSVKRKINFVRFSIVKSFFGLILAVFVFLFFYYKHGDSNDGIYYAISFLLVGLFKFEFAELDSLRPKFVKLMHVLGHVLAIGFVLYACFITLDFLGNDSIANMGTFKVLMNLLCAMVLYSFFMFLFGRAAVAALIVIVLMLTMSTINGFVYTFREKEFCFLDIYSAATAANVVKGYSLAVPAHVSAAWADSLLAILFLFSFPSCTKAVSLNKRIMWGTSCLVAYFTLFYFSKDIHVESWMHYGSHRNGYYLNFYMQIRDSFVHPPNAYSADKIDFISSQYKSDKDEGCACPNIIVIMNESFADFDVFPNTPKTNIPVTPFIDSLEENTIKGYAYCSVFGGSTANSEYEFLTGHSMAFFPNPTNCVPYQQYINEPIFCLPYLMNSIGYKSFATHPYNANGWSRNVQYPRFGFQEVSFEDSYVDREMCRNFVSDAGMYEYILDTVYSHNDDRPLFIFGITMQNHGGYDYPASNHIKNVELETGAFDFSQAEYFLSLIHRSDKAVEYLLGELANYHEDTIVCFFGDHLPKLEDEFYAICSSGDDSLGSRMKKYTVPFFIWANYDIEEYTLETTSLNYLAGHLLDVAGIELPPYYQLLREIEETIPAINAFGYYSKSQESFIPFDEAEGEETEALRMYEYVQYNNMFDAENRNEILFAQYMR